MKIQAVSDYYDDFVDQQRLSGVNDRIYRLYKLCIEWGLLPHSNVLELGCGIGAFTFLLSNFVKKGQLEAVDLSPKSIEFAKERIKKKNISFSAGDVIDYKPALKSIDFITLFDIIEHIPLETHDRLFQNLSELANENTKILINIPNPAYIEYDMDNNPDILQIIDQPVPLSLIAKNLENYGLSLIYFKTYSIWVENDYQFFVIEKKKKFKEIKLSSKRTLFQKITKRLEKAYLNLRYRYV